MKMILIAIVVLTLSACKERQENSVDSSLLKTAFESQHIAWEYREMYLRESNRSDSLIAAIIKKDSIIRYLLSRKYIPPRHVDVITVGQTGGQTGLIINN